MPYSIDFFCVSHIGKCRRIHQDNFCCMNQGMDSAAGQRTFGSVRTSENPSFAVFDGMGGEKCGEIAAQIAADVLKQKVLRRGSRDLVRYCEQANREICGYASEHGRISMGTTVAMVSAIRKKLFFCNMGDSKIFRFFNQNLQQISLDHVSVSPFGIKPPLYQYLGMPENQAVVSPHIGSETCRDGTVYLLCSDGLTDMVPERDIEQILHSSAKECAADDLLNQALRCGGKDNITILLLYIHRQPVSQFAGMSDRIRSLTQKNIRAEQRGVKKEDYV